MGPLHRAVVVDVAWQTGSPEKFSKAWSAMARGDAEAFSQETKVLYRNRSGELVEDERRGELRAAMLAGHGAWAAAVQKFGNLPTTALQAMAANAR